ncbi:HAD family hydrolase [Microbacterium sp. NPDC055903]
MTAAIDVVFFDLDGTLVHDGAGDAVRQTAAELARRHGLSAAGILGANAEAWRDCWSAQGERWMRGELGDDALPREIWRLTLERFGRSELALVEEAVALHVRAEEGTFTLYEETVDVLEALRGDGVRLGLITNGPARFQRAKLTAVGIEGLFDLVVASGDIGVLKPETRIFRHALDEMGVAAEVAVHVGDNFGADVVGAVDTGMRAVWINRDGAEPPRADVPHVDGRSLRDVLSLLGQRSGIARG